MSDKESKSTTLCGLLHTNLSLQLTFFVMMVNRVKLANIDTLIYQDSSIYIRVYAVLHLFGKSVT